MSPCHSLTPQTFMDCILCDMPGINKHEQQSLSSARSWPRTGRHTAWGRHSVAGMYQGQRESRKEQPDSAHPNSAGAVRDSMTREVTLELFLGGRARGKSLCTAKRMAHLGNGSKFMGSYMGGPFGQTAGDAGEIGWVLAKKGLKCWAKECGFFLLQVDTAWSLGFSYRGRHYKVPSLEPRGQDSLWWSLPYIFELTFLPWLDYSPLKQEPSLYFGGPLSLLFIPNGHC